MNIPDLLDCEKWPGERLKAYFDSIKTAFEGSLADKAHRENASSGGEVSGYLVLALVGSLIPAIPGLLTFVFAYVIHREYLPVYRFRVHTGSFLFWYLFATLTSLGLIALQSMWFSVRNRKRNRSSIKVESLSEPQMRFALSYATLTELAAYRTNKRQAHIDSARRYWGDLLLSLQESFGGHSYLLAREYSYDAIVDHELLGPRRHRYHVFFPAVRNLLDSLPWFRLDPDTNATMDAFDGLRPKINGRIADKKDFSLVLTCLCPLVTYLYAQIPDLSDTEEERRTLDEIAEFSLQTFSREMSKVTPYKSEKRTLPVQEAKLSGKRSLDQALSATFSNDLAVVRFVSWWVALQVLTTFATAFALIEIKGLKLDSTMTAMGIGSPLAVAAALTAIPSSRRPS